MKSALELRDDSFNAFVKGPIALSALRGHLQLFKVLFQVPKPDLLRTTNSAPRKHKRCADDPSECGRPGANVHVTLHSSLNVIGSAPHAQPAVPVDGNAESAIAVSPFASYKGPPFAHADGVDTYHSDESDEGECVSSRSASLQVSICATCMSVHVCCNFGWRWTRRIASGNAGVAKSRST